MTMHLLGPAYSTTSTKKRKGKKVAGAKYEQGWREHNKLMRKHNIKEKTLQEYIRYCQGKYDPKLRGVSIPTYTADDHREKYPSAGIGAGSAYAREVNVYTGTRLIGIATMHKSNLVPVFSREAAEDIAKMRR